METKNLIMMFIGIAIFMLLYFSPKIWKKIKATKFKSYTEKKPVEKAEHDEHKPKEEAHGAHDDHGHNDHSASSKTSLWSVVITTTAILTILLVFILGGIWAYKKVFPPKKHMVQVSVEVRRKSLHLTPEFNNTDSIHIEYGQYTEFKFASVPFCAQNGAGYIICDEAYSDPDFPKGSENQDQWVRAQRNCGIGNIVVVVYERQWQEVFK